MQQQLLTAAAAAAVASFVTNIAQGPCDNFSVSFRSFYLALTVNASNV